MVISAVPYEELRASGEGILLRLPKGPTAEEEEEEEEEEVVVVVVVVVVVEDVPADAGLKMSFL